MLTAGYPEARQTRFAGLFYGQTAPSCWRVIDAHETRRAAVGPVYRTREELLADLGRYARETWALA